MKYLDAFEIAAFTANCLRGGGLEFKLGVERAAALAAVDIADGDDFVDVIARTIDGYRCNVNSRWDGSIA